MEILTKITVTLNKEELSKIIGVPINRIVNVEWLIHDGDPHGGIRMDIDTKRPRMIKVLPGKPS